MKYGSEFSEKMLENVDDGPQPTTQPVYLLSSPRAFGSVELKED